jgi:hypothetical protein
MTLKNRIEKLEGGHGDELSHFGTVYTIANSEGIARSEYSFHEPVLAAGEQITTNEAVMLTGDDVSRLLMSIPGGSRSRLSIQR